MVFHTGHRACRGFDFRPSRHHPCPLFVYGFYERHRNHRCTLDARGGSASLLNTNFVTVGPVIKTLDAAATNVTVTLQLTITN